MLARPELILALDANIAVGDDFAGLLVHADLVGGQEGGAVADQHPAGAHAQAGLEIELRPALSFSASISQPGCCCAPSVPGRPRTHRASASMERSRVIRCRELTKTSGGCQAAFKST